MVDSVTPTTLVVPASLDPKGMPSFIQMEQHEEDKRAAEAFVKVVSKKDKDGFAGLIPKAFLAEANEADAAAKLTSTSSEMGKYLATLGIKIALEDGLAKAINATTSFAQLLAGFGGKEHDNYTGAKAGSGYDTKNSIGDNEIFTSVAAIQGIVSQSTSGVDMNNGGFNQVCSQYQNFYSSASFQGNYMAGLSQANRTVKNALDKMVSQMQGEAGTVSSIVSSLYSHGS
jgi:hypothetical protein